MNRFTRGIATASARHPWRTIAVWAALLLSVLVLAATGGGTFGDDFEAKGSESARAMQLLDESFPEAAQGQVMVVFAANDGSSLDAHRAAVGAVLRQVDSLDHVATVADPFAAGTVSHDGRIGFARVTLDAPERDLGKPAFTVLAKAVSSMNAPGVQVELGGDAVFLNAEDAARATWASDCWSR